MSCPGHYTPGERVPATHSIGGWVGPIVVVDVLKNRKVSFLSQTPDRPACSPVTIPTTLSCLPLQTIVFTNTLNDPECKKSPLHTCQFSGKITTQQTV